MPATQNQKAFVFNATRQARRRKITPIQMDEIKRRKDEGESLKDLALEFGITVGYIRQL